MNIELRLSFLLSFFIEIEFWFLFVGWLGFLFSFFWLHHVACEILVPWPGVEPMPPAVEARSPNHWTAKEFQEIEFLFMWLIHIVLDIKTYRFLKIHFNIMINLLHINKWLVFCFFKKTFFLKMQKESVEKLALFYIMQIF